MAAQVIISVFIHYKKPGAVGHFADSVHHLVVAFVLHIFPVHLHHTVPWSQPGHVSRGAGLHFADVLPASVALTVQVKAIAAVAFSQETEPWSHLALHPSTSIQIKQVKVSQESNLVPGPKAMESPWLLNQSAFARSNDQKIIIIQHDTIPLMIHDSLGRAG